MLNPDAIGNRIVEAWQSIPEVSDVRITYFDFQAGVQLPLAQRIYQMTPPEIIVACDSFKMGNYNGQSLWRFAFGVYIRTTTQAYGQLLWHLLNKPVLGTTNNIREIQLLPDLDLVEVTQFNHSIDENKQDYFVGQLQMFQLGDDES